MEYREIEIFCAVMEHGSVTAAARVLGVSQPAVSKSVAKLANDLGFSLFRRDGRRLVPTPEARLLYTDATRIVGGFERFGKSAEEMSAGQRGMLTIGSNPNAAIFWLPSVVAAFQRERPLVQLRLLVRGSEQVRELATANAFDLGIAEAPFSNAEAVIHRYTVPRVVVLPRAHRLAAHEVLTPQLLNGEAMVATTRSNWSWGNVARVFDQAAAVWHVVVECELLAVALNMVSAGVGLCLVDPITAATIGRDLIQRPFRPTTSYDVGLLAPSHCELTVLARMFAIKLHDHICSHIGYASARRGAQGGLLGTRLASR